MTLTPLEMIDRQTSKFVTPKSASEKHGKEGSIALALDPVAIWCLPESLALVGRQPVAKAHTELFDALHSPYPGCQVGAEKAAICSFVCETPDCSKSKVDGARGKIARLQMHPVPDDHRLAERQPRFRAIPFHEFVDRMPVTALSVGTRKAVEDGGLCDLEVRQAQDRFGSKKFPLASNFLLHDQWPPIATGV
jgi:hypothetical protein